MNPCHRPSDLPGHKGLAATRTLVIEQNPVRRMQAIALPVVHRDPVGVDLRRRVGASRIKRGGLFLRNLLHQSVHLGTRSLIKSGLRSHLPHRIQQPDRSQPRHISRKFRNIETHPHMALRRQIVNLVRFRLPENFDHRTRIAQIPEVQKDLGPLFVPIPIDPIQPLRVEAGRSADNSMHLIPLLKQKLRKVRAVLPRDPGNQSFFRHLPFLSPAAAWPAHPASLPSANPAR